MSQLGLAMPHFYSLLPHVPGKSTLALLFKAAKRRVAEQSDHIGNLSDVRIESATEELNQIADDVRDAQETPEAPPSIIPLKPAA